MSRGKRNRVLAGVLLYLLSSYLFIPIVALGPNSEASVLRTDDSLNKSLSKEVGDLSVPVGSEVTKNADEPGDLDSEGWLVSVSPHFNGASTSIGAPVENPDISYPVQDFNPAAIKPNNLDSYNPLLKSSAESTYQRLTQKEGLLITSSKAGLEALQLLKKREGVYRMAKFNLDKLVFDFSITGVSSILVDKGPTALREMATAEYLISKKREQEVKRLNEYKAAEVNLHAIEDNYNSLKKSYEQDREWLNLLLSINSDVGDSAISTSTLKYLLNSYWEKGQAKSCSCSVILNFSSYSYSDIKSMEKFISNLGVEKEVYESLFVNINGKSVEAISSPFGLRMNSTPSKRSIAFSALNMVNFQIPRDGLFTITPDSTQSNYPKSKTFNSEFVKAGNSRESSIILKGFSISNQSSKYGPDSIILNYEDFQKIKRTLGLKSRYKLGVLKEDNLVITSELNKDIWRARSFADTFDDLAEENTSWAPAYWEFLPSTIASSLVDNVAYKLTDGSGVIMARPDSIRAFTVPILQIANCSVLMEEALSSALLVVKFYGLSYLVNSEDYGGCYSAKKIEGSTTLSYHARGMAVDINVHQNMLSTEGNQDKRLVEIFDRFGLRWGGYWNRKDPMHFELASLMDPLSRYSTL